MAQYYSEHPYCPRVLHNRHTHTNLVPRARDTGTGNKDLRNKVIFDHKILDIIVNAHARVSNLMASDSSSNLETFIGLSGFSERT